MVESLAQIPNNIVIEKHNNLNHLSAASHSAKPALCLIFSDHTVILLYVVIPATWLVQCSKVKFYLTQHIFSCAVSCKRRASVTFCRPNPLVAYLVNAIQLGLQDHTSLSRLRPEIFFWKLDSIRTVARRMLTQSRTIDGQCPHTAKGSQKALKCMPCVHSRPFQSLSAFVLRLSLLLKSPQSLVPVLTFHHVLILVVRN